MKDNNELRENKKGNYIVAVCTVAIIAAVAAIIAVMILLFNINGKPTGIVKETYFNMSVSEMKKLSGEDFEVFDETDISGCRSYMYNYEYGDKSATLIYVMQKRPFGYRLCQLLVNVIEANEDDLESAAKSIADNFRDEDGFSEQNEGLERKISTDKYTAELSLKDGYLSISVLEK